VSTNQRPALLRRNVKRFRGGLVFKGHRLLHHSTLGVRVIILESNKEEEEEEDAGRTRAVALGEAALVKQLRARDQERQRLARPCPRLRATPTHTI